MNLCLFSGGSPAAFYALSVLLLAYGAAVIALTLAPLVRTARPKDVSAVDTGRQDAMPTQTGEHSSPPQAGSPMCRRGELCSPAVSNNNDAPGVSVVIPFRNEACNLSALLASIDGQNYGGMIEVVLVNDRSMDEGVNVIKKFTPRNKNLCINVVDLYTLTDTDIGTDIGMGTGICIDTDKRLTSKQQALELGVDRSSYRLILFTDADMILEPTWVGSMVESHLSTGADMVFGHTSIMRSGIGIIHPTIKCCAYSGLLRRFAPRNDGHCERSEAIQSVTNSAIFNNTDNRRFIDKLFVLLESYQLEYLFSFAHAFSKLNLMGSCMGNNILITKEAYAACGGQRGVGYSIVEDRALLGLVRRRGFKTAAQEPFTATAWTYPSQSKRQFADQTLRWARGGLRPGGGLFAAGLLLLTQNILFLLSMMWMLPPILALPCVVNFILTWAFLSISFHRNGAPVPKILFPVYYIFMMIETAVFLPLMLFGRGVRWKDRKV